MRNRRERIIEDHAAQTTVDELTAYLTLRQVAGTPH